MADPQHQSDTISPPTPEAIESAKTTAARFHAEMPFDVKMPDMELFVLTRDKIKNLQASNSDDSVFFGAGLAVVLTTGSIAVSLYVAGNTGKIFMTLCVAAPFFLLPTLSYGLKYWKSRKTSQAELQEIETQSRTIVTLIPKGTD